MSPKIKVIEIDWLRDCCWKTLAMSDAMLIDAQLSWLLKDYSLINYNLGYDFPIWRGRKCDSPSGFQNIRELSYPPPELTKANRLNNPGTPVLYAAFNKFCVFEEIGAGEGDYVHLVGYRIKQSKRLRCCMLGEVLNVHRSGRAWASEELGRELNKILNKMPSDAARSFIYIDAFFSSILRDKDAASKDYLHSRTLGSLLPEKLPGLDAIVYPSVALDSSMNLAIMANSADMALELIGTSVVQIRKKYEYGIFDFFVVRNAKGNFPDGQIQWE